MAFRRLLGLTPPTPVGAAAAPVEPETATIRRIVSQLEQLDPERRRYLAGFAYILGRAANADLEIKPEETALMEQIVRDIGALPEAQAVLVVEIAKHQAELYGGTEDFLVTRDFAGRASPEQKKAVLAACFAVVASDHEINAEEYSVLTEIATELDVTRDELNDLRRQYRDEMTAIQSMRSELAK